MTSGVAGSSEFRSSRIETVRVGTVCYDSIIQNRIIFSRTEARKGAYLLVSTQCYRQHKLAQIYISALAICQGIHDVSLSRASDFEIIPALATV